MEHRLGVAMQQLVRHGALIELLTLLQTRATVENAANLLAQQWKFCANVTGWRFVFVTDEEALRIDGTRGKASVQRVALDDLLPWERLHASTAIGTRSRAEVDADVPVPFPDHLQHDRVLERIVLPARVGGRPLGVFFIGSDVAPFDALDRKFIELVASLFAARVRDLMHHQSMTDALRREATIDALTQVANRRQFDSRIAALWQLAERKRTPLSLALIDIDFFKQYNDCYGHPRGDSCLRDVARLLQSALRPTDLIARVGGEEFAIVLPNVDEAGAMTVAERARAAVAQAALEHQRSSVAAHVTISVGVASLIPDAGSSAALLYTAADAALYEAKHHGRDRVHTAAASLNITSASWPVIG